MVILDERWVCSFGLPQDGSLSPPNSIVELEGGGSNVSDRFALG